MYKQILYFIIIMNNIILSLELSSNSILLLILNNFKNDYDYHNPDNSKLFYCDNLDLIRKIPYYIYNNRIRNYLNNINNYNIDLMYLFKSYI